jgi:hypothetical protein
VRILECSVVLLVPALISAYPTGAAAEDAAAEALVVEVDAGGQDRQGTPVFFELPERLRTHHDFHLTRLDNQTAVEVQRLPGEEATVVWLIRDVLRTGQTRRYRLAVSQGLGSHLPEVVGYNDGKHLLVTVANRPVLQYNLAVLPAPEGLEDHFKRSGHIHPLFDPAGRAVTDDFPPDHAHQHGIFFAWVNTQFEGRPVDFWNQAGETGRVGHVELLEAVDGNVFAQFTAALRHDDLTAPDGPKPALDETWSVRVYNLSGNFLVDIESRQRTAGESPLEINEFHYGGMAFRGSRHWFEDEPSDFLTSEGKTRLDGNHTRPRWVEAHGLIDGRPSGVTAMCHPDNFRFPQPVRLHPTKPYFCFSPMVEGRFAIERGQEYVSRYRYSIHTGLPDAPAADRLWHDYAQPPRVRVVENP